MKNLKYLLFSLFLILSFNIKVDALTKEVDEKFDVIGNINGTRNYFYGSNFTYVSVATNKEIAITIDLSIFTYWPYVNGSIQKDLVHPNGTNYYLVLNVCTTEPSAFRAETLPENVTGNFVKIKDVTNRRDHDCFISIGGQNYGGKIVTRSIELGVVSTVENMEAGFYYTTGIIGFYSWGRTTYANAIKILSIHVFRSTDKTYEIIENQKKSEDDSRSIWLKIADLPSDIWSFISTGFTSVVNSLGGLGDFIVALPSNIWNAIKGGFTSVVNSLGGLGDFIVALPSNIWNAIKGGFTGIVDVLEGLYHWIFKVDYEIPTDVTSEGLTGSGIGGGTGFVKGQIGWFPAGPVDNIINLPFTFLNNINTNLSNQCTPASLPLPYVDKNLPLPCINSIYSNIGTGLTNWIQTISVLISGLILYRYFLSLYKWVDNTLTFRENNHLDNWGGL